MTMSETLALMERAARKAGTSLVQGFQNRNALEVTFKNKGDFVSQADMRSEKIITDVLQEACPDFGIMGEENEEIIGADKDQRWIIDPLDGTTMFLHGVPHWSITIAKQEHGEIVAGLVYDPIMDEMFTAVKGQGAFLNGEKISASTRTEHGYNLISMNAGYLTFDEKTQEHQAWLWKQCIAQGSTVCSKGGLALQLAYVAAGRYDGCLCWKSKPWDWCAGALIVSEAGGVVSDFSTHAVSYDQGEILAGSPAAHDNLIKLTGMK